MNYYYLLSALPYLRVGSEPSLSSSEFLAQCAAQMPHHEFTKIAEVNLIPRIAAASVVESKWNEHEIYLRNILVKIRAAQHHHEANHYLRPESAAFGNVESIIRDAYNRDSLQLEEQLDRLRWRFLDDLSIHHEFDFTAVFIYLIKLLLLEKRIGFDAQLGQQKLYAIVNNKLQHINIW